MPCMSPIPARSTAPGERVQLLRKEEKAFHFLRQFQDKSGADALLAVIS